MEGVKTLEDFVNTFDEDSLGKDVKVMLDRVKDVQVPIQTSRLKQAWYGVKGGTGTV